MNIFWAFFNLIYTWWEHHVLERITFFLKQMVDVWTFHLVILCKMIILKFFFIKANHFVCTINILLCSSIFSSCFFYKCSVNDEHLWTFFFSYKLQAYFDIVWQGVFFSFFQFVCLLRWQFSCQFVSKYMQIKRFSLLINWCQVGWSFWISYKNADLNEALVIWKEHETGCTYSNHKLSFMTPGDSSDEEWLSESGIHLLVIVMREIILSREMQSMCGLLKVRNRCIG